MMKGEQYLELDYKYKQEPRNYKVGIVSLPSNLGKGEVWYFLCPQTNKRCRKLYSVDGFFFHREAFHGCVYESQIQSKKYRQLDKSLGSYLRMDELHSKLYEKGFKRTYAGKPTKRFLGIMKQIEKAKKVSNANINLLHKY